MSYTQVPGKNTQALTGFHGRGIYLYFQDGSPDVHGENGTTNEEVIQILIDRLVSLNEIMSSLYNYEAIRHLQAALDNLKIRTQDRKDRGVEGTMKP